MPSVTVQPLTVIAATHAFLSRAWHRWTSSRFAASRLWAAGLLSCVLAPVAASASEPRVTLHTTLGDIVLALDEERAPQTVKNFLDYVDAGYYENTLFHRVIDGFMIQGGGFNQNYQKKTTRAPVSNEAYNGLRNRRYTIAMARTTAPHSATSQFFINSEDNSNLDHVDTSQRGWGYAVFGRVVEGEDVVDAISSVRTGAGGPFSRDVPLEPVVILRATRQQTLADSSNSIDNSDNRPLPAAAKPSLATPLKPTKDTRSDAEPLQPIEQN